MALLVHNLDLDLDEPTDHLAERAAKKLRIDVEQIRSLQVVRKSLDCRPRHMRWVFSVMVRVSRQREVLRRAGSREVQVHVPPTRPRTRPGGESADAPPVVVGAGPAGLFAALLLAEAGYRPIVLDRGQDSAQRDADVNDFIASRTLNTESNFLFGEGGAGAYSDGKLTTRIHDPLVGWVLQKLVAFGADDDIAVNGRPHIGSDKLPGVCRRMRGDIERSGGQVRYGARLDGVELVDGKVRVATLSDGQRLGLSCMLLGIGHSARDTYAMLARQGIRLSAKPFQMGVRIEHPQVLIDQAQLGQFAGRSDIGPADYHLVARAAAGEGDVYTFCMCPGGRVLPINNQEHTICTNGGSRRSRDSGWASSAVVTGVAPERFSHDGLEGLAMQERIERACFLAAGGDYTLCGQRATDFLAERASSGTIETSSLTGVRPVDFNTLLPRFLCRALHNALPVFAERIAGFAGADAVLLGPETRASCPVRIDRHRDSRASLAADNLYPIGEGAGYAGGIVSAAVDGLRSAEAVIARYAPTA